MKRTNKKAFTIVELVIVIAVIAILAAVLIPTFSNVIKSAHETTDSQLVRNLNTAVKAELAFYGKTKATTAYEALQYAKDNGYDVATIVAKSDYNIAWSMDTGSFVLIDTESKTAIYPTTNGVDNIEVEGNEVNYFLIVSKQADAADGYSIYAGADWEETSVTLEGVGFDAGENTNIETIEYEGAEGKEVVIRTNGGTLTINDTNSSSHQVHYGTLDKAVVSTGTSCYVEHGIVDYMKLEKGKAIAGEGGIIYLMKADSGTAAAEEDGGVIIIPSTATSSDIQTTDLPSGYTVTDSGTTQPSDIADKIQANRGLLGSGTEEDPYQVYDCATFKAINDFKDLTKSYYFKVNIAATENGVIDLSELVGEVTLNGSFNGNGVVFKNLVGDSPLFRYVDTNDDSCAVVENFTMDSSCNITRSYGAASVIRDLDAKTAVIKNVTTYATVNATTHSAALIGYINNTDNHAWSGSETKSNCTSVTIENCTVAGVVYTTGAEPASLMLGYNMALTGDKFAEVVINNCNISFGHLYVPSGISTEKGYAYGAQNISNFTVDGATLTNEGNAVAESQISKYLTINPIQSGSGYTFEKAAGATSARIQLEARGSIDGTKGCCFVLDLTTVDISSQNGAITIPNLSKITNVKLNGNDSYENMYVDGDGVMYLHLDGYDAGTANLAKITVTQYSGSTVLSTGTLSLPTETDGQ